MAWRDGGRDLVPAGVIAVLFVLQSATVHAAGPLPWLGELHPLLGAVVMVGLVYLMRSSTAARESRSP